MLIIYINEFYNKQLFCLINLFIYRRQTFTKNVLTFNFDVLFNRLFKNEMRYLNVA